VVTKPSKTSVRDHLHNYIYIYIYMGGRGKQVMTVRQQFH